MCSREIEDYGAARLTIVRARVLGFERTVKAGDGYGFDREAGFGAFPGLGIADAGKQQPELLVGAELLGVGRMHTGLVGKMREAPSVEKGHGVHQAEAGEQEQW